MCQPVGKIEKSKLLSLLRVETAFNQIDNDAVRARTPALRQRLNTACDGRWQADALPDISLWSTHVAMLHQHAPVCTSQ